VNDTTYDLPSSLVEPWETFLKPHITVHVVWMLCAASIFCCLLSTHSEAQTNPLTSRRAQHLRHGINTSIWFAQSPGNYSVQRLQTFTTTDDLKLIHQLGFDHIRLSIDATPLLQWQHGRDEGQSFMRELDRNVDFALAQGLAVIIDLHPESPYKQTLLQGNDSVESFAELWVALAKHFSNRDPELVFFEIMNEPEQNDPYRWEGIENMVAGQIRQVAPAFTLIAGGARYSGLDDLLLLQPLSMPNVIYTFHDYEPFAFTHQGATWTLSAVRPLHGVPYPSTSKNVSESMAQEPTLAGQLFVENYGLDHWDEHRVDASIAFAERWSKLYDVPVYCGEFGAHRPFANAASRERWIHDMRVALEHHGIGWAMWDYQTNFGVVTKQDGETIPDAAVIRALGLKANP
jgi:endoglucanase